MGEIIQIHIGQAGTQIGTEVWDLLHQEYSIDEDGQFKGENEKFQYSPCQSIIHKLFQEQASESYYPRCIFLDTEPNCIEVIKKGKLKKLFNPDNLINGKEAGAYYSRSYYTLGRDLVERSLDRIRKEVEKCSSFQGFIFNHSICGGTGSGLACLLMENLNVAYGKKVKATVPLFPSLHQQEIIEPYNATLSIGCLVEHIDLANCIDNTALYNILSKEDQFDFITYKDINRLIAQMQSSLLVNYSLNGMQQFQQNLVPYPSMHFISGTAQPIQCLSRESNLHNLIKHCFSNDFQFLTVNRRGKLLSSAVIGRGDVVPVDLIKQTQDQISQFDTVKWIPDNLKIYHSDQKSLLIQDDSIQRLNKSVSVFQNNTSIRDNFNLIAKRFDKIYQRNGFSYWFSGEGMEAGEFSIARDRLEYIQNDYTEFQRNEIHQYEDE